MRVGVPREIKPQERRVALTPAGTAELTGLGHEVLVERGAGEGAGFPDDAYAAAGARLEDAEQTWGESDLVVKVKEPIAPEYRLLRDDLILFTYLHLAADEALTRALLDAGTTAIAYETVQNAQGRLPLLAPMSAIAGRLAAQSGAHHLTAPHGGRGVLLGPVPGVAPAHVVVVGGGVVGYHAASVALGLGARVTLLDVSLDRLEALEQTMHGRIELVASSRTAVEELVSDADVVIGAVLVPGARAPRLLSRDAVAGMREGSVLCDVAIDQGGCAESSRPTTHADPTFVVDGVVHYCVANMPGAVPVTSTRALTNATLPFVLALAEHGWTTAVQHDTALARGVTTTGGRLVSGAVAVALGLDHEPLASALPLAA